MARRTGCRCALGLRASGRRGTLIGRAEPIRLLLGGAAYAGNLGSVPTGS